MTIEQRLDRIEQMLEQLLQQQQPDEQLPDGISSQAAELISLAASNPAHAIAEARRLSRQHRRRRAC